MKVSPNSGCQEVPQGQEGRVKVLGRREVTLASGVPDVAQAVNRHGGLECSKNFAQAAPVNTAI